MPTSLVVGQPTTGFSFTEVRQVSKIALYLKCFFKVPRVIKLVYFLQE